MSKTSDDFLEKHGWQKVATGTWYYGQTVPKPVTIWAKPARFASSRFDDDDQLNEGAPIPATTGGYLYCCEPGNCGEHLTLEEAKAATSALPWGPVQWHDENSD